ncbi:hypothetical protein FS837_001759 [Tulasnella sp. UAMH 9824]|nr:hypothetical protein FS837_001759 [Tulasnella sp. UAMH 9824]
MSTTAAMLDDPVPLTRRRRASFNEEIELSDLRDVEKDSKAGNEDSVVPAPKTPELGSVISVANERLYLAVLCWGFLVLGWNDGTLGPLLPTIQKNYNSFKCLYCKAQNRPVDEEFCSARCQDDASRAAPLLIKLEATDPIYKEVNALFGFGWKKREKPCPSVKRIFRIMMKLTLMEYYNAYRLAVEEQGNFTSKGLKPGNEKRIWAGIWSCYTSHNGIVKVDLFIKHLALQPCSSNSRADDYSVNGFSRHVHNQKALLLASVVMGEVFTSDNRMTSLPAGFQSISCQPGPNSDFNYNDTAVYSEDAIRPAFLVIYDAS